MLKFTQKLCIWDGQSTQGIFQHETSGREHFLTLFWGFEDSLGGFVCVQNTQAETNIQLILCLFSIVCRFAKL